MLEEKFGDDLLCMYLALCAGVWKKRNQGKNHFYLIFRKHTCNVSSENDDSLDGFNC